MTTLYISNLSSNNISMEGENGKNRLSLSAAVGASPGTLTVDDIIGDSVICNVLSGYITAGTVRVNIDSVSGTVVTAAGMLQYASGSVWDNDGDGILDKTDIRSQRLAVTGLAVDTLNDEVSAALGGASTDMFVPEKIIVHMEDVGAGAAAAGDYEITVGTATGGTQILAATACTGCNLINETFQIALTGVLPKVAADATIYVRCTTADTTAGAGHLVDAYLVGELIVAGA